MCYYTIITVNKNNAEGLQKTIKSVINQTYKNFEYIIIDGNSNDQSVNIIKKFENHIKYWISENDNGIYHAMNKGILRAIGTYCLFLNSGDYLYNSSVLHEVFQLNKTADLISGKVIKYSDFDTFTEEYSEINSSDISLYNLYHNTLNHQATFIKRSLFEDYGLYEEKYKVVSDWLFFFNTLIIHNVSFFFH